MSNPAKVLRATKIAQKSSTSKKMFDFFLPNRRICLAVQANRVEVEDYVFLLTYGCMIDTRLLADFSRGDYVEAK